MTTDGMSTIATAARWGARALSVMILLFWGLFLVASLVGDDAGPSRPLVWGDYVALGAVVAALVGLALAWRWELTGAAVTLVAVGVCAAVNWRVLLFPGTLIPFTALLFVLAWWLGRASGRELAAQ